MLDIQEGVRPGQVYQDTDFRNYASKNNGTVDIRKPRQIKIIAAPTLSSPGVAEVIKAPNRPHTVGKRVEFTLAKIEQFYARVS